MTVQGKKHLGFFQNWQTIIIKKFEINGEMKIIINGLLAIATFTQK